jgi:hypothetical protein
MKLPSKIELAFSQLLSKNSSIRKLGAQSLSVILPFAEARAICEAFQLERDPGVAKWLALTLGKMRDKSSLGALQNRLKALDDGDLRHWIMVAINMIQGFAPNRDIALLLESTEPIDQKEGLILSWNNPRVGKSITESQIRLLDSDDPSVRRWAALSFGSAKDFTADAAVITHLNDPDHLVLEWTEHVITGHVPKNALKVLYDNLSHPEPRVREWAIKALASTGSAGVWNCKKKMDALRS